MTDLVTQSGREGMTADDRRDLLAAEMRQLQGGRTDPNWRHGMEMGFLEHSRTPTGATVHDFNRLMREIDDVVRPRSVVDPARLSRVECLVLAWRRGGADELRRVRDLQRGRRTP